MKLPRIDVATRIALYYLLFGGFWILLSDRLLILFSNDPNQLTALQTYKGWFFVTASALLVYFLLKHDLMIQNRLDFKLHQNEERLRLALYAAQQGIYDLNVQTGEAIISDIYATMLGYDPGSFHETNAKWLERLHPDDVKPVGQVYRDYVQGKTPEYRVEFRQKTKSGEWKWILSIGKIVEYDQLGRPLRMLGTHTNITESKNSNLRIQQLLVENAQLIENLKRANEELILAYDATIEGWSMAMDLRDRETEGHTRRVTDMTVALARKMNVTETEIIHLRRGALLHDIGKMGIPDAVLLKPGL